jgi:hypothetical protein
VAIATTPTTAKENKMMKLIIDRLNEASTWRGIIALVTAAGVALSPEQQNAIVAVGLAAMGVMGAFMPDNKPATPQAGETSTDAPSV